MAQASWDDDRAEARIRALEHLSGALLPMLHALMDEFGYIDSRAVPLLAQSLNISRAEVVGVINFYHDFRQEPGGRHTLKLCRAEACQSMGCERLLEHVKSRLATELGGTSPDGEVTLEAVYCLGNCALSPAMLLDDRLYGRVSERRFDEILAKVAQ